MSAVDDSELPAIDFATFVLSLSHSVLVHLGDAEDPSTHQRARDLPMAQQTLHLLGLLQEKTRGNLTGDEERVLDQALIDLKLRLAEVEQAE